MKYFLVTILLLGLVGCAVNSPQPPPQNNTIIIRKDRVVPMPPPQRQPDININIKPQQPPHHHGGCTVHSHCGRCDVCRRNGWISINIKP